MALKTDNDLFEQSTMTFGEHLEELRKCLMKAVIGLVIGTVIGFFLGDWVVDLIGGPLKGALKTYYMTQAEKEYQTWAEGQIRQGKPIPYTLKEIRAIAAGDKEKNLPELIYELEFIHPGLMSATLAAVDGRSDATAPAGGPTFAGPSATGGEAESASILEMTEEEKMKLAIEGAENAKLRYSRDNLAAHLLWHPIETDGRFNMQSTNVSEPFTVWLKASLVVGVVISSPWVFYHLWTFVAAGLYSHERKYVYTYMPFSIGLFLAGAALAYLMVFKPVLDFLFNFNKDLGIDPDPKIGEWLSFVLILPLGFGISFQLPLVMLFLERIGVFTLDGYLKNWRIAVLVIFVLSAVLTPADPYSLLFMAVPLTLLYFGGILLAKYLPHHKPAMPPAVR